MIVSAFDGMNFSLSMSPRELKLYTLALGQFANKDAEIVAGILHKDGFEHTGADVAAVVKQFVLAAGPVGDAIYGPNHISDAAKEAEEDMKPKPKETIN